MLQKKVKFSLALLLCNMVLFYSVGRAATVSGEQTYYGNGSLQGVWSVSVTTSKNGSVISGSWSASVEARNGYSGIVNVTVEWAVFNSTGGQLKILGSVTSVSVSPGSPWSGSGGGASFDLKGQPAGYYTTMIKAQGTRPAQLIARYYWDGTEVTQVVKVMCDLNIANSTGGVNPDGWVEIDGVKYGPAPVGGLVQTVEVGDFKVGETIQIAYGSGVSGAMQSYVVPGDQGNEVTFPLNVNTIGGGSKVKYKFQFVNLSETESCNVIFMGANLNWTVSPQRDNDQAHTVQGEVTVAQGTTLSLIAPLHWTIIGAPAPHQVFGFDDSWVCETPIILRYDGPVKRVINVRLKIVDETDTESKKVSIMRNDNVILNGLSVPKNTTNASWAGEVYDGETIWFKTSESGYVLLRAPLDGVVSSGNVDFVFEVEFPKSGEPPVTPPVDPPVDPPTPPIDPPVGPPVDPPVDPPVGPPDEPPDEPKPPEEPPVPPVEPPLPPIEPPPPPPENPGTDELEAINNLQKALIEDGQATRELMADGFNGVIDAINRNTNITKTGLDQIHRDLTEVPGSPTMPEKLPLADTGAVKSALSGLNPIGRIVIPATSAPVFDLTLDIGVVEPIILHWDLGEEPWSIFAAWVRRLLLCFLFIFGSYALIRVVSKGISSI